MIEKNRNTQYPYKVKKRHIALAVILVAIFASAIVGGGAASAKLPGGVVNVAQGNDFFENAGENFMRGVVAGAATGGIGSAPAAVGTSVGRAAITGVLVNAGVQGGIDTAVDMSRDLSNGRNISFGGVAAGLAINVSLEAATGGGATPGTGRAVKKGVESTIDSASSGASRTVRNEIGESAENMAYGDILSNKALTNQTGKVNNYISGVKGDVAAHSDFNAMNPNNIRTYPNGTIVGDLTDGTTANLHPSSSLGGTPTVEIYDPITGISTKIRY